MVLLFIAKVLAVLVTGYVFLLVRKWLRLRAILKWGEQFGCGEPPCVPNKLPGGLERYKIVFTGLSGLDFLDDIIRKRYASMGRHTYRVINTNSSMISTADPLNIQAVLGTQFHDFDLSGARKDNFTVLLGHGIFTSQYKEWVHYRHQLKPQFTRDQVSNLHDADRHIQVLFKALPEENGLGWLETDLMPLLYRFTMDVSTEFLFGQSVNSQSRALHSQDSGNKKELQEDMDFADAMNSAQEYLAWRMRLGDLYWLAESKKFLKACKTIHDFADRFVRIALDPDHKKAATIEGKKEKFVLLDELVEEVKDPIELRDQVLQILLAGRDTTAALLSWTFILLARHQKEFEHLREAIISQFGTEESPTKELTFSSLKTCKEITHVIYEVLRLYPTVPLNGRRAIKDTILPTGGGKDGKLPIAVAKGESVGYHTYVMHRRKDIWGEDADDFVPKRWEGRKLGWEFIPFSGGPRVCLGQQYALNEASFVLVKMLRRYDRIEALDMTGPLKKGLSLTLSPGNGVKVKLHRAA